MAFMFYFFLAALLAALAATLIVKMPAARIAAVLRWLLPLILGASGIVLTLFGRAGIGLGLIGLAGGMIARMRAAARGRPSPNRRSHVRSAALEMELDLDSGAMNGLVLAGRYEGKELDRLNDADLLALYEELKSDVESRQLLEAYLDRRMAGWRDDSQADSGDGLGAAPGTGAMTEQEAYQILGLGSGAGEAEIREAHRRLMKRVHPDAGGSDFLAARINEAKDVLLRRHQ